MEIDDILRMTDRGAAFIELVRLYLHGSVGMRCRIERDWDYGVDWKLPDQSRLACQNNERWSCEERIKASLAYSSISSNHPSDYREELIALAVIYQSCIAANLDPRELFEGVAKVSVPDVGKMFLDFLSRSDEDKCLSAFLLLAEENKDGEIEIRPAWSIP